jgi:type IV secretory pathway VirB3-like protein
LYFQATTKIVPDIQVQRPLGLALWIIIVIIIVAIIIGIFLLCLIMLLLWKVELIYDENEFITLPDANNEPIQTVAHVTRDFVWRLKIASV